MRTVVITKTNGPMGSLPSTVHGESTGKIKRGKQLTSNNEDMHTARTRLRKLLSYVVSTTIALQVFGVALPTMAVHAAAGDLVINEVNWAGSTGNASDEWLELYNNSGATIDFSATPYTVEISDETNAVLGTITLGATVSNLPNHQFLLVYNNPAGTTINAAAITNKFEPAVDFNLPNVPTNYRLLDSTLAEVDAIKPAGIGDPIPFEGTSTGTVASMERINPTLPGTDPLSWRTSKTVGAGFVAAVEQFGTPGAANVELAAPTNNVFSPFNSVTLPTLPTLSGDTDALATSVIAKVSKMGPVPGDTTQVFPVAAAAYSGTLTLSAGRYQIAVAEVDAAGNRSDWANVAVNAGMSEYNYVVLADASAVTLPVVDPYDAVTNLPVANFTGTSVGNSQVDVLLNGEYYQTVTVAADTFSVGVALVPNSVNHVEFISVDATGAVSTPVMAMVTHDAIAPLAVDTTKVVVSSNTPGTNDSLVGIAGAAEAATTISFFKDAAATMPIGLPKVVNGDGSFSMLDLGDNLYGNVYMRLEDLAGNQSPLAMVENKISFVPVGGITIAAAQILQEQAKFTWNVVPGAVNYMVKYRAADGTFSTPMKLCATGSVTCAPELTVINLTASKNYVLAIAAVDMYGNSSVYTEYNFKTADPIVVTAPTPAVTITTAETPAKVVKKTTTRVQPSPTPVPTAQPTKAPEASGEVKSSTTEASKNWTPWIILGVLAGIAALATLGYFYWFGGSAGEAALAAAAAAKEKSEKEAKGSSKKTSGKEKRW